MTILAYRLCFQPIFCGELTRKKRSLTISRLLTVFLMTILAYRRGFQPIFLWGKLMTRKKPSYYNNYPTNGFPNDHSCLSSLLSAHFLWGNDAVETRSL